MKQCQALCNENDGPDCDGEVRTYRVVHSASGKDFGYYDYCEVAAQRDRDNGFTLTEVRP